MSATRKNRRIQCLSNQQNPLPGVDAGKYDACRSGIGGTIVPGSADLIISPLALHLTNDTPGVLVQMRRALKPDGLLLAATPGAGTLGELRESLLAAESELTGGANTRVHPFADIRDYGALLQRAGFALPVTDIDDIVVRYADMFGLLKDLRAMGMTSMLLDRSRKPVGRSVFLRAAQITQAMVPRNRRTDPRQLPVINLPDGRRDDEKPATTAHAGSSPRHPYA